MYPVFTQQMYDGVSISFNQFKNKFAYDAEMFGWDEKIQAKMVKNCLTGIAKDTYDFLSSSDKEAMNAILDALKKECVKKPDYNIYVFSYRKFQNGQSIQQFCTEIQEIVDLGFLGLDATARTSMLRARLVSNVQSNLPQESNRKFA